MEWKYLMIALILVISAGCSMQPGTDSKADYRMPASINPETYIVDSPDGVPMQTAIITDNVSEQSSYDMWLEWRNKTEQQDKYDMLRHVWENENAQDFSEREEDRIEQYCKDYGFERCMGIDRTCEEDGCHRVTVECDDDNYDPGIDSYDECHRFKVTVDEDVDDALTESADDEVICD